MTKHEQESGGRPSTPKNGDAMSDNDLKAKLDNLRNLYLAWRKAEEDFDCTEEDWAEIQEPWRAFWAELKALLNLSDQELPAPPPMRVP